MPNFAHLLTRPISYVGIKDTVRASNLVGAGNQEVVDAAEELAKKQAQEIAAEIISQGGPITIQRVNVEDLPLADSEAIAIIAYLQRLGVDLFKPEPTSVPTAANASNEAPATN
jgi:cytochrome c oxidase cbb3-type subunit I/II